MDGHEHYDRAMQFVAMAADPDKDDDTHELLLLANVHMTAALLHALKPDLAKRWSMP